MNEDYGPRQDVSDIKIWGKGKRQDGLTKQKRGKRGLSTALFAAG